MNSFLQRMLNKKSDVQSDNESIMYDSNRQHVEVSPRSSSSKESNNWLRKLGAYSPKKRDFSPSVETISRPITSQQQPGHHIDYRRRSVPEPLTVSKDSLANADMPDLEKIIHEFERGFLSPTKQEPSQTTIKSGRFVKQIVAAFEEKYKVYNDYQLQMETEKSPNDGDKTMLNEETSLNLDKSIALAASMGRTYIINSLSNSFSRILESCENKSVMSSSCRSDDDESVNFELGSFAMDDELLTVSTPEKKMPDYPSRRLIDNPKSIFLDRKITSAVEKKKITPSNNIVSRSNSSMRRERQPKIIGAFLKKPIEVEDTSIDWIPVTGKKLPRKKSFKRLLSVLMGKKSSHKCSKLYGSEINLPEKNHRELHDSGYDEKSCSSSCCSVSSLISITDLPLQRDNCQHEVDRRNGTTFKKPVSPISTKNNMKHINLKTFQAASVDVKQCFEHDHKVNDEDEGVSVDDDPACSGFSKRLLLEEVPRSEVRLSLGPSFPLGPRFIDKSWDDDDEIYCTISEGELDNYLSKQVSYETLPATLPGLRPKQSFESFTKKIDNNDDASEKNININNNADCVELRRDFYSWQFTSTEEAYYDIPRRYMSKSDPGLATIGRADNTLDNNAMMLNRNEVVYDVPKRNIPQRPRSSVYEDALSLKRRNANFDYSPRTFGFSYAFPSQEEPHYATIKPRNTRICPTKQLIRSMGDVSCSNTRYYTRNYC